jgi:nucleoside-diphosphate-sugar epimerase
VVALMSATLAITGATGFVGSRLSAVARAAGHPIRALTRGPRAAEPGQTWIEGTLDNPDALARLAEDADAIVHVAGLINAPDRAAFDAVNVAGTATMVDAARDAGVKRFIHISSLAAREPGLSDYGASKARSEQVVASSGLDWTIVRPPAIYGPGDRETFELFKMARRGFVALPPKGHFSVIHVDDLANLILTIIAAPDSVGETYEPDDGREGGWEHRHFARTLSRLFGKRATTVAMPGPLLKGAARLDRLVRRGKAKLTPDRARYFCHPDWVAAAQRRPPTSLWTPQIRTPTGLKATAEWYLAQGWLR